MKFFAQICWKFLRLGPIVGCRYRAIADATGTFPTQLLSEREDSNRRSYYEQLVVEDCAAIGASASFASTRCPSLVATIQALEPSALGRIICHIGLEDCGEIIALATTEQIKRIFDEDLWKSERPGEDEKFDAERFALWLEVMLEAGEDFVAEKLVEFPEDLVTAALNRHILVVNIEELRQEMDEDEEDDARLTDKALDSCLYEEFDDYQVISRRYNGWDTITTILLALDKNHHTYLLRILERICHISKEYIDNSGGLYEVLTSTEVLEDDLAGEREERRARDGFIAPSSAASFLRLGRIVAPMDILAKDRDAVTRAYFRDLVPNGTSGRGSSKPTRTLSRSSTDSVISVEAIETMLTELETAEIPSAATPASLLQSIGDSHGSGAGYLFGGALATLSAKDPGTHSRRLDELAYLCNVLVAGCAMGNRAFRPVEAVVAVAAVCNLGLEHVCDLENSSKPKSRVKNRSGLTNELAANIVSRVGAEKLFRVGFYRIHVEVAMFACSNVMRVLLARANKTKEPEVRGQLERLAKDAQAAIGSREPWKIRHRVMLLSGVFGKETMDTLAALLTEYPFITADLVATCQSRFAIDAEHHFISTQQDIGHIQAFLRGL